MSQKIYVIYTDDTKPRRYIASTSRRTGMIDSNLAVETTTDLNQAHDFGSNENTTVIIPRLHNPFERKWKATAVAISRKKVVKHSNDDIE